MSKHAQNRNKKSPMFVSNMVTQYDFVDYTGPGQAPPSAFGNPNSLAPTGSPPKPQQTLSPQKAESTNWFDQMLKNQQQTSAPSPNRSNGIEVAESRTTKTQSYQSNYSSNVSNPFLTGQSVQQQQPLQTYQQSPNRQQETSFTKKQVQFESKSQQPFSSAGTTTFSYGNQGFNPNPTGNTSFEPNKRPAYSQPGAQQQQQQSEPKYNFKTKTEPSRPETSFQPSAQQQPSRPVYDDSYGKLSQGNSQYSRPQQQQQFQSQSSSQQVQQSKNSASGYSSGAGYSSSGAGYSSSSAGSSGTGFSNEDLVNSLPEPARSNILAMIRRSKGQN